ncbi:MAG: aminoacetone oxidase family FAD-binding enzyme, partial [Zymomonas sp.]
MMAAAEAGKRGRSVLVVDHAATPGEKIRISGGGRCNFTNVHTSPKNFLSANPSFSISALKRYPASAFIALVERYGIAYHEKALGQLFCDGSAAQIVAMLMTEMREAGAELRLGTSAGRIRKTESGFSAVLSHDSRGSEPVECTSLII